MNYEHDDDFDSEPAAPSDAMKFEVRLTEYNMSGITHDISEQLANRVMRDYGSDIKQIAREIVTERVNLRLEEAIRPIIDDALGQPMVPTDAFGKPKGEPTTAKDIIAAGAAEFLQMSVSSDGKTCAPSSWGSTSTRLSWLMRDLIDKKFASEIEKSVAQMKRDIQKQMQDAAAAWLADFQMKAKSAFEKVK